MLFPGRLHVHRRRRACVKRSHNCNGSNQCVATEHLSLQEKNRHEQAEPKWTTYDITVVTMLPPNELSKLVSTTLCLDTLHRCAQDCRQGVCWLKQALSKRTHVAVDCTRQHRGVWALPQMGLCNRRRNDFFYVCGQVLH